MNIGNLQLPNNLIMAPLAGITDLPFRTIVRRCPVITRIRLRIRVWVVLGKMGFLQETRG